MGASEGGCSTTPVSGTGSGFASLSGLPDASGGIVEGTVDGATVEVGGTEDVVVTRNVVVGLAVVEGTTVVSGEVDAIVSSGVCVLGGGAVGVAAATVEEVVEVEVVDVSCSTVLDVCGGSVDVVVGGDDDTQTRESSNQRSGSAGTENPVIGLSSFASTTTVVSQHEPSTVLAPVVPSL